ncbi:MAG: divergent polysaccharide deacetylase family protein [Desulfovibrio sp.]
MHESENNKESLSLKERLSLHIVPVLFGGTVLLAMTFALGWFLLFYDGPSSHNEALAKTENTYPKRQIFLDARSDNASNAGTYLYGESAEVEENVKRTDYALLDALYSLKNLEASYQLLSTYVLKLNNRPYHVQDILLGGKFSRQQFVDLFQRDMLRRAPASQIRDIFDVNGTDGSELVALNNASGGIAVLYDGVITHRILFPSQKYQPIASLNGRKVLALIIDDMGQSPRLATGFAKLPFPVNFAIMPYTSHPYETAEIGKKANLDILVHFPMEPKNKQINPGGDALLVNMTAEQIREKVKINLDKIPQAIGVNNHMGSRFTAYPAGMHVALEELNKRGVFFLDSYTSGSSVGRDVASRVGIPFYKRDVFIDNNKDMNAIHDQLDKAEYIAYKYGQSIAIGHIYPETLAALKQWQRRYTDEVDIVKISQLPPN